MSEESIEAGSQAPKKSRKLKSGLLLLGFAGLFGISAGIFAANITVNTNSGGEIEFGTGTSIVSSCVSSAEVEVTTAFVTSPSPQFELKDVNVTNIVNDCSNSEVIKVDVMNSAGVSLVTTTPSHTITATSDAFSHDFSAENVDSGDVAYVLLETSNN